MKTRIITVMVILILCLISTLCMAGMSAKQQQQQFWNLLQQQDAEILISSIDEKIQKEIDVPVADSWMKALAIRLGKVQKIEVTNENFIQKLTGRTTTSTAIITCEKGTANSQLTMLDDKILAFNVKSTQMKKWFTGVTDTEYYQDMAQNFITQFLNNNVQEAYNLMHVDLQAELNKDELTEMMSKVCKNGGKLISSNFKKSTYDAKDERLSLIFEIECEHARGEAEIQIQFKAMTGDILGFYFR